MHYARGPGDQGTRLGPSGALTAGATELYTPPMTVGDEKFISVTTYRKSGAEVVTPTWVVPLDGDRIGFWTSSASGKIKRLRNNPRVTLRVSDQRGRVAEAAPVYRGTAQLVTSGPEFETIQTKVKAKYGAMVPISRLFNKIGHLGKGAFPYGDVVVVVTLEP